MNKNDLIALVAERNDLSKQKAQEVVETVFDSISESLSQGKDVTYVGFGKFGVTERKARKGRNPQTGESMDIPASKSPSFKAGKALKERVQ
jgi:DNA-binding protein HU-beta